MTTLSRAEKERQGEARRRVRRIRDGMKSYIHTLGDIAAAYAAEDWKTLGYLSWAAYVDKEFGASQVGLPPEQRQKAVEELRLAGLSNRAIAAALNVGETTVRRDAGAPNGAPIEGEIVDLPARSSLVEAITGAIEDAAERAQDHREPAPGVGADTRVGVSVPGPEVAASGEEGSASSPASSDDPRPATPPPGRGSSPATACPACLRPLPA